MAALGGETLVLDVEFGELGVCRIADGPDQVDPVPVSDVRIGDRGPRRPGGCNDLSGFSDVSDIVNRAVIGDNRQAAAGAPNP